PATTSTPFPYTTLFRSVRQHRPVAVHLGVIFGVLARLDPLPPLAVGQIPLHRLAHPVLERVARGPTEGAGLARVERIAAVVAGRSEEHTSELQSLRHLV